MGILFFVVAVTLGISAVCSLLEATLYSTRVATLEAARLQPRLRRPADRFLHLKRDIASPTAAILILNTVANTAGATIAGMYAVQVLGGSYVPLFSALLTVGILLLSEILPKTFGATHWRRLWPVVSLPLTWLVSGLSPLIWVTRKFSSLFETSATGPAVTEDEIRASIRLGAKAGELSSDELRMLDAVFRFEEVTVGQIMVPRDEVVTIDLNKPVPDMLERVRATPHSRFPACRQSLDDVVGLIHIKDASGFGADAEDLGPLVRDVPYVPEMLSIARAMKQLQAAKRKMAIVVDEFGTVSGIVTLTDILEQIVGTLDDELDVDEEAIVADKTDGFIIRGNLSLNRINHELGLELYDPTLLTLSGLIVRKLGRLPQPGDKVDLDSVRVEVLEVKSKRASRIHLRLVSGRRTRE